jgi:predicted nicotinamide N-methyase
MDKKAKMASNEVEWVEDNEEFGHHKIVHHNESSERDPSHIMEFDYDEIDQQIQLRGKSQIFKSTGLTLWTSSQVLSGYLIDNPYLVRDKRVLELGAGMGLCGIVAHYLGSSKVCATDGDVKVLDNLRYNMKINGLRGDDSLADSIHDQESEVKEISCHQLIWDKDLKSFEVNHGKFPVIMGTDVFYASESVGPLWNTVDGLLESDGVFLLAFVPHKVSIAQVLDKATQLGFTWDKPNISGTAEDNEDDYFASCSFGYHVFLFRRE